MDDSEVHESGCDIAIVGMAGRFPGAENLDEFWRNLHDGVASVSFFTDDELLAAGVPRERFSRPDYVRAGARMAGFDLFDAEFFGYTPREATVMDPQQRVFLETAWAAIEHAGYAADRIPGAVGVFGGASTSAYLANVFANLEGGAAIGDANVGVGNELAFLTTRVSYKLNLRGPSIPVHTACSSSLVAVHLACQSLLNRECDTAVAGGVSFKVPPGTGYTFQEGGILSPDGHCRPFDAHSQGTVFNNGAGAIVLKRLSDAVADNDTVYAVIKGTAVNNDGADKASFTAPGVAGQAAVVLEALELAGLSADSIGYVEAHGSGTKIGDAIEVEALTRAFRQSSDRTDSCVIGSVKGNLGHLDAAAGIAGLLKTVLALRHGMLPPTPHFTGANSDIDFERTPFRVQGELTAWERTEFPRRAGVSAFGFGGTNAHVVLEEAPPAAAPVSARESQLLVISARTPDALDEATSRLAARLDRQDQSLVDVAFTLAAGRQAFPHRRIAVAATAGEAARALSAGDPSTVCTGRAGTGQPPVAFLFPGQGAQHPGMVADLYRQEPVFRAAVDNCADLLRSELDIDLRALLIGGADDPAAAGELTRTRFAQPALFTVSHALAELWASWGITPRAMLGHSVGEYVAACRAGVFALADALHLVALRGRLMQELPPGAMLSVSADRAQIERLLPEGLALAAHNGPADCVVSGGVEAVAAFAAEAARRGLTARRVATSHAFHSALVEPMVEPLVAAVARVPRHEPQVPFVSNVTGDWITGAQATDPAYWGRHARATVEFAAGLATIATEADVVLLEVGPGQTLTNLARRVIPDDARTVASLPHRADRRGQLVTTQRALGRLWLAGVRPDWTGYHGHERPRRVALPSYPFQRSRYWLEPAPAPDPAARVPAEPIHPLLDELLVHGIDEVVFRTEFDLERHWMLSEHRMLAEAIVPGTTYLEMARAAGAVLVDTPVTELSAVEFQVPLLVRAGHPRVVHTTVRRTHASELEFTVVSRDPAAAGQRWSVHARGRLSDRPLAAPPRTDVTDLAARCTSASVDVGRAQDEHDVMEFGGRWRESLRVVDVGAYAALGRLRLPDRYRDEIGAYALHPALLDLATGFHRWAMLNEQSDANASDGDFYLPIGYDRLSIHRPMPARCVSFIRPTEGFSQRDEIRKVDVLVLDEDGDLVLDVAGFTAKRVNNPRRTIQQARPAAPHHTLRWVRTRRAPDGVRRIDRALVVGEPSALRETVASALRDADIAVTVAALDDAVDTNADLPPEIIFVAPDGDPDRYDLATQDRLLEAGVLSLARFARSLSTRAVQARRITVVARHVNDVTGEEPAPVPAHSALFGLAKVIGQEDIETVCRCVDVDGRVSATAVAAEIIGRDPVGQVVLRGDDRYVAELVEVDLDQAGTVAEPSVGAGGAEPPEPGPERVYLITGGLGGLGLQVALSISETAPGSRFVLVGRRPAPPRERWDDILEQGDDRQAGQVRVLQEIERRGCEVRCYQADVADLASMSGVVAAVRRGFGRITDVVHAAGTAGDGFLVRKPPEVFRATLAPKVTGAMVLEAVTDDDPPDTMILFSSTTALLGSAGQSDYTAANLYLDGFAAWRSRRGRRTITVNWTDWLGTGMAADFDVQRDQGFFRSIEIDDAIESFRAVVRSSARQVIVGEVNYPALAALDPAVRDTQMAAAPIRLGAAIRERIVTRPRSAAESRKSAPMPVTLVGRADGRYRDLERSLGGLWAAEFGVPEINVSATLFDLGGDSLLALRLANSIQQTLGVRLTIADLFAYPTVADLATHLEDPAAQDQPTGTVEDQPTVVAQDQPAEPDWFELWNVQIGLWLQHQLAEGRAELNLPAWQDVHQAVDVPAFRRAVAYLVQRHDALRLVFRDTPQGPRQAVLPVYDLDVPLVDLTGTADPDAEVRRLIEAENRTAFDDLGRPPVTVRLFRLGAEHHTVYVKMHHIMSDGTSIGLFLRELAAAYESTLADGEPRLDPLPMTFEEYLRDRLRWLSSGECEAMRSYWLRELAPPLPRLRVGDYEAPVQDVVNESVDFTVPASLATGLAGLARRLDVTRHVVLLSAYLVTLRGISGDDDIVMCVPFSGRDTKELEGLVGIFVNPLSLRLRMADADPFEAVVHRAQRASLAAYAHSRYPFSRLVDEVPVPFRAGHNPIFSAAFQFTEFLPPAYQTSQLDICLYGRPGSDGLAMRFSYNSQRLSATEVAEIQAGFLAVLARVVDEPAGTLLTLAEPIRQAQRASAAPAPRASRLRSLVSRAPGGPA
ncbi:SDR family NAD(P)-dependent oxidoreductase [Micromonospora sp. FIMYZ51]|uniref:SDR family NAD(P)-dependent oxidoreductase n=1 Tax=Micromonospora sp. FIMYZ51 TaxID=3051832 RepID=UPI00311FFE66